MLKVPDWRDPSRTVAYKSLVRRWDNDKTYRKRQESQCLWDRDSAILCDGLIKEAKEQSARNFDDPALKFSWEYRQSEQFVRRFRPAQLVQSRDGGSSSFSHRQLPSSATLGGMGTRPEVAMTDFTAGPPKRRTGFAGGDPLASPAVAAIEDSPWTRYEDEELARPIEDDRIAHEEQEQEEEARRHDARRQVEPMAADRSIVPRSGTRGGKGESQDRERDAPNRYTNDECFNCGDYGHHARECQRAPQHNPWARRSDKGSAKGAGKRWSDDDPGKAWSSSPWKSSRSSSSSSARGDPWRRRDSDDWHGWGDL